MILCQYSSNWIMINRYGHKICNHIETGQCSATIITSVLYLNFKYGVTHFINSDSKLFVKFFVPII